MEQETKSISWISLESATRKKKAENLIKRKFLYHRRKTNRQKKGISVPNRQKMGNQNQRGSKYTVTS